MTRGRGGWLVVLALLVASCALIDEPRREIVLAGGDPADTPERVQHRSRELMAEVNERPDEFGGAYWGVFPDGRYGLTVAYPGLVPPPLHAPIEVPLRFVPVNYSMTRLMGVVDELTRDMRGSRDIYWAFVDVYRNAVEVGVADADRFRQRWGHYGDLVIITPSEPFKPLVASPTA